MLFSGITFIYFFLPCALIIYYAAPKNMRNSVLLALSIIFYGWSGPKYLILLSASVLQGFISGIIIERTHGTRMSKVMLGISVALSVGTLVIFKYSGLPGIILPVGISFYTFQIISYVADVYRGACAQHSFVKLALYICMFPQLIAGPIVRYSDIASQLDERSYSAGMASYGISRFVTGLAKKILIANTLGSLVGVFKAMTGTTAASNQAGSVLFYWIYAAAYTLQIYYDFSGYSDMAVGLGAILGFSFPENFNYPYIAASITDFWRRWHISLGTWFRDYVYIPLGGSREGRIRTIFNIMTVWLLTGIWHGAGSCFAFWGLFYGLLLINEKLWLLPFLKRHNFKILPHLYVMFFVMTGFVLFDADNISEAMYRLTSMFGLNGLALTDETAIYYLRSYLVVIIVAIIGATPFISKAVALISGHLRSHTHSRLPLSGRLPVVWSAVSYLRPVYVVIMLALCTAYLVDGSFNPFLYFRF